MRTGRGNARWCCSLFPFEIERDCLLAGRSYGYVLFLCAKSLLPGSEGVLARGQVLQFEPSVSSGHCEVRIGNDANPGMHPGMYIAFDPNHDLRLREASFDWWVSPGLAVVPFPVHMGTRVNIVGHGIGVCHLELLTSLDSQNSRDEPASFLVHDSRLGPRFELLAFQP